jgi:hypothetical protein
MQLKSAVVRLGLLVLLVLGCWWIWSHRQWISTTKPWAAVQPFLSDRALAITGAAVLAIFFALLMWGRFNPWQRRSAHDFMGDGCVTFAAIGVAGLGLLLAVGWYFHIRPIIRLIALITVFPALQLAFGLIFEAIKSLRKKLARRERRLSSSALEQLLAGHTHVIPRTSSDNPPRRWRELRFYAPDGRMTGYAREADGHIRAYPAQVTWRIEHGRLVTLSSLEPGKPFRYTLTLGHDGQVSYRHYEPGSKLHGLVLFRTVEVTQGEPPRA